MTEQKALAVREFSGTEIELIKSTIAVGATDKELQLFLIQCHRTGLDPFSRQIHAIKRWNSQQKKQVMTIQIGIDGSRLIAERTETYAPGKQPSFEVDDDGQLISATAYGWKLVAGRWFEVSATAYYEEYVQTLKGGSPNAFWRRMPRGQLAKCAEALLLRKCCPQELSGLYTDVEMGQADNEPKQLGKSEPPKTSAQEQPKPSSGDEKLDAPLTDSEYNDAWDWLRERANENPKLTTEAYSEKAAPLRGKSGKELSRRKFQDIAKELKAWRPEPSQEEELRKEEPERTSAMLQEGIPI